MKKRKLLIPLLLSCALLLGAALLSGCESGAAGTAESGAPSAETGAAAGNAAGNAMSADKFAGWMIVRSDTGSEGETKTAIALRDAMKAAGCDISITTDWVKRGDPVPEDGLEILVGTTNRADSVSAAEGLRYDDYKVFRNGNHIVLLGGSDKATRDAVDWFLANVLPYAGEGFSAEGDSYIYTKDYRLTDAVIAGKPISDYTITCDNVTAGLSDAAASLQALILEETGYLLPVQTTANADTRNDPQIRLQAAEMAEGYVISCTDTGVTIAGSDRPNVKVGASAFEALIRTGETLSLSAGELAKGKAEFEDVVFCLSADAKAGGDGSASAPFSNMEEVLAAVEREADKGPRHITVKMTSGQYLLSEPLTLTGERFDKCGISLDFVCEDEAGAVLAAWVPVTGFSETTVNGVKAWEAPLPTVRGELLDAHQFFTVSGERLTRPRFPETGYLKVKGVPGVEGFTSVEYNTPTLSFNYGEGEIPTLSRLDDVQVVMYHYWDDERKAIASIDESARVITFTTETGMAMHDSGSPAPYFLDNVFEALDAPGEVYADAETKKLYYIPRDGETLGGFTLYASDLEKLLIVDGLRGSGEHPALSFSNITFAGSDWKTEARSTGQAANDIDAAVTVNNAEYVTFENCTFTHIGDNTIKLIEGVNHITFDHCVITDVGGGGIQIAGVNAEPVTDAVPHDITITDCRIDGYGRVFANGVGILLRYAYDCVISHNEICDGFYTAISVGWSWGYNYHVTKNILVEKNHLHDIGQALLSDMGGIYTLGLQPGTVLRGNLIHDIRSRTYGGWGIYPDEGSSDILVENNICYNFTEQPFHQHYGENNVIRNNIFAFGDGGVVAITRLEDHNAFTMEGNILLTNGQPIFTKAKGDANYTDRNNLMWDTAEHDGVPTIVSSAPGLHAASRKGMCEGSIIEDPCFTDAEHYDFSFTDPSAAVKIGFVSIDMSDVGVR